ncbi:MAG: LysR family transcriptional regulator [Ottowia sp.]|uniref:LysR substrate-binding domain-containing protein n=1 Tax=unclassified Ottowia TaxID=2645081 RepID=UPI003C2F1CF6
MKERSLQFDLNLVRVFVAIFETRSVTQAAERLGVSQPSVSHALSRLRELYGDRLFSRGAQGLIASAAAERLFEQVSVALSALEGTLEAQQGFDPASSTRRFRIAASDIGALFFIPPLLRRFQDAAPKLQVEFIQLSDAVMDDLATGALDLAVGNLPSLHEHTKEAHLFTERYVCLLSADYPVGEAGLGLSEFQQARHVMVTAPSSGHAFIDSALAQRGVRRNMVALIPHFSALLEVLEGSDLLVIIPSRVAHLFASQKKLKVIELPVELPEFQVRMHWHVRSDSSPAHRWLRDAVVQSLSRL